MMLVQRSFVNTYINFVTSVRVVFFTIKFCRSGLEHSDATHIRRQPSSRQYHKPLNYKYNAEHCPCINFKSTYIETGPKIKVKTFASKHVFEALRYTNISIDGNSVSYLFKNRLRRKNKREKKKVHV